MPLDSGNARCKRSHRGRRGLPFEAGAHLGGTDGRAWCARRARARESRHTLRNRRFRLGRVPTKTGSGNLLAQRVDFTCQQLMLLRQLVAGQFVSFSARVNGVTQVRRDALDALEPRQDTLFKLAAPLAFRANLIRNERAHVLENALDEGLGGCSVGDGAAAPDGKIAKSASNIHRDRRNASNGAACTYNGISSCRGASVNG
jgi:hypothetical protein